MASINQLQQAVRSAGGNSQDSFYLAGIAYCLTGGDPGWIKIPAGGDPGARGAWGVSQKWYPGTPADLAGQAKQALSIYRQRGIVGTGENIAAAALLWWYPSGGAPEHFKATMQNRAADYKIKARSKFQAAGFGLGWILIAGVAIWYFFGRKK